MVHSFYPTGSFAIRYLVKRTDYIICVLDVDLDWVSWGKEISFQSRPGKLVPNVHAHQKVGVLVMNFHLHSHSSQEISKTFFQPKIIPPFHSCQISEPSVGKFVKMHKIMPKIHVLGHFVLRYKHSIRKSCASYIFHSSDSKFWTVNDVIFRKREQGVKQFRIVSYALGDCSKNQIRIDKIYFRFSCKNTHWNLFVLPEISYLLKITSTHCIYVRAYWWGWLELPNLSLILFILRERAFLSWLDFWAICDYFPGFRWGYDF